MTDFDTIVRKLNVGHEVTNPRVRKNLEVLTLLKKGINRIIVDHQTFSSIKFLNRKGLLKYKKGKEDTDELIIYPTLLYYYLTLVLKYDIYRTYSESIKLYHVVGEKLNDVQYL